MAGLVGEHCLDLNKEAYYFVAQKQKIDSYFHFLGKTGFHGNRHQDTLMHCYLVDPQLNCVDRVDPEQLQKVCDQHYCQNVAETY